jgi:hypothetical protein
VKEPGVTETLAPLAGAEVELTGSHAPASTLLKITAVNGAAIVVPTAAPTVAPATTPAQ